MLINTYSGIPLVYLLDDGRTIELASSFCFCDSRGIIWTGDVGEKANGTSYPPMLWSLSGGPWSTKSRWGAILHDIHCKRRDKPWQAVHHMFGEAIRVSGVPKVRAQFEYNMVYQYGPRWTEDGILIKPKVWDDEIACDDIGG